MELFGTKIVPHFATPTTFLYKTPPLSPVYMSKRSRHWCFTLNNYDPLLESDDALDAWLNRLGGVYAIAGREVAPATSTRHLQGFVSFKHARILSGVRRIIPGAHLEPANGTPAQSRTYCSKDASFRECGDIPQDPGNREKQRWEDARTMAKEGRFDDIPADIYVRYIGNLHRIYRDHLPPLESLPSTCGTWIVGPTGSGKSRGVRDAFPLIFPKPLNKWWDGYDSQPHVLLDDVDHNQSSWIGHFLKIWADHYPFIAEKKGGSRLIRPERIIVTSQYHIYELFQDQELIAALNRRFTVVNKIKDEVIALT